MLITGARHRLHGCPESFRGFRNDLAVGQRQMEQPVQSVDLVAIASGSPRGEGSECFNVGFGGRDKLSSPDRSHVVAGGKVSHERPLVLPDSDLGCACCCTANPTTEK